MTDSAALTALVTGGTAVLSGLLGYAAARGQQLLERARIASDEQRARDALAQASEERREADQQARDTRREELYLDYLKILDEYVSMVLDREAKLARYSDWWLRFQSLDNQMDLYASESVVEANRGVYADLAIVSEALKSAESFATDVRRLFGQHRRSFEVKRSNLVAAMRQEVLGLQPLVQRPTESAEISDAGSGLSS